MLWMDIFWMFLFFVLPEKPQLLRGVVKQVTMSETPWI